MGPFRVDFAMNRGHELILDREIPIKREELDTMEMQMLRANPIPFLLPIEWVEIDGCVTFRYSIEGKRMMPHQLQLKELTMHDFYACLLAIAEALDACKSYLLRQECCLLQETYIFVGDRWDDVSLLYVPFRLQEGEQGKAADGGERFMALAMRLAAQVKELDGSGLQQILKHCHEGRGIHPALKSTLLQLIGGEAAPVSAISRQEAGASKAAAWQWIREQVAEPAAAEKLPSVSIHAGRLEQDERPMQLVRPMGRLKQAQAAALSTGADAASVSSPAMQQDFKPTLLNNDSAAENLGSPERTKWLLSAAAAIAIALVWRYGYASHPSSGRMMIAFGATAVIAASLIFGWRSSRAGGKELELQHGGGSGVLESSAAGAAAFEPMYWPDSQLLERRMSASSPLRQREAAPMANVSSQPQVAMKKQSYAALQQGAASHFVSQSHVAELHASLPYAAQPKELLPISDMAAEPEAGTGVITDRSSAQPPEATVWIGNKHNEPPSEYERGAEGRVRWLLERSANGKLEQVALSRQEAASAFVIGRYSGKVDYADEHPGISRVHLEFDRSEHGCSAKDMGSRNGTTLNGSPMIAYKNYKLQSGDALQLAGNGGPVYTVRQISS